MPDQLPLGPRRTDLRDTHRDEVVRALGLTRTALQLVGHYGRAQDAIERLFAMQLQRAGIETAKVVSSTFRRISDDDRKLYLRAVLADLASPAPVERMLEVFGDAKVLRDKFSHLGWSDLVLGTETEEPAIFVDAVSGATTQRPIPLSAVERTARRLEWLIEWVEWVMRTDPELVGRDVAPLRALEPAPAMEPPDRVQLPDLSTPPSASEVDRILGRILDP